MISGAGMPVSLPDIGLVPYHQPEGLSASVSTSVDSVYADQPAATLLDDVSQMFNERGYLKSNQSSFDEQEIVSDYGGNLMYSIPLYSYTMPQTMKYDVKLTYNGSVGHSVTLGDVLNINNGTATKYNLNSPEWIISVNDIAVQVFNFEFNYFSKPEGSSTTISGNGLHKIIPGYQYCDRMMAAGAGDNDRIMILAGDGSLITLVNTFDESDTGDYVYEGRESYYKAKVTYSEDTGFKWYRNRRMELMKGDGNVFIFNEYKVEFEDFERNSANQIAKNPQLFLLEKIIDQFGNSVIINYDRTKPIGGFEFGRPFCTSIASSPSTASVSFLYGTGYVKVQSSSELSVPYQLWFDIPVSYNHNSLNDNRTGHVDSVFTMPGRYAVIKYQGSSQYQRIYSNARNPDGSQNNLTLDFNNLKRMSMFRNYLGGVRNYTYFPQSNSLTIDMSAFPAAGPVRTLSNDFKGQGRDPFFSNMLYSRSDSDSVALRTVIYDYVFEDPDNNFNTKPVDSADTYRTESVATSQDHSTINNSDPNITTNLIYRIYPINDFSSQRFEEIDVSSVIKLMSSETKNDIQESVSIDSFYYEKGNMGNFGWNGSFLMTAKLNNMEGARRTWRYQYDYFGNDPGNPPKFRKETDPYSNVSETTFDSLYRQVNVQFNGFDMICYLTGLPKEETKRDSYGNVTSRKKYGYYTDTLETNKGYFGQMNAEWIYGMQSSDSIATFYEYYRHDTLGYKLYEGDLPECEGQLKKIIKPDGEEERHFYNVEFLSDEFVQPGVTDDAPAPMLIYKVKYENGVIDPDTIRLPRNGILPVRIDRYKRESDGTADTLDRNYYFYNAEGLMTQRVDFNRFLTAIAYNPGNRVSSVTLPGDFSTQPNDTTEIIIPLKLDDTLIINSTNWGNIRNDTARLYGSNNGITDQCDIFSLRYTNIGQKEMMKSLFLTGDAALPSFNEITMATLRLGIYKEIRNVPPSYDYEMKLQPVVSKSEQGFTSTCTGSVPAITYRNEPVVASLLDQTINTSGQNIQQCNYTLDTIDLTAFLNNYLITEGRTFIGFSIYPFLSFPINGEPQFEIYQEYFCEFSGQTFEDWKEDYSPRLTIAGEIDLSDTLRYPNTYGGTIFYDYDDAAKTVDIKARMTPGGGYENFRRTTYHFDGFANIKKKDIYTGESSYNSYKYRFNYSDKPARNFNALGDSTMFSYDALGRLIKTKNSDLSATQNFYDYYNNFTYYFGTVTGFIEKRTFTDEEGNNFEKYYDAVGNLLREVKFVEGSLTGEDPPGMLITDYRYDSLYRLTKVKTPEGNESKLISYSYDKYGRQSQRITPDAGQTDYIYDRNNNLTYTQDANQRNIDAYKFTFRNYDALNRLTGIGGYIFQPSDNPDNGNQFESSDQQDYLAVNVYDTVTIENSIIDVFNPPSGYYDLPNYTKGRLAATAFRTRQNDNWSYKYYRYDERGRVKTMWQMIDGLDVKTVGYEYNSQDMVVAFNYNSGIDFKRYRYRYDNAARLQAVDTYEGPESTDDPAYYTTFADYAYNPNSAVETQNFLTGFTGTTLGYDNRGRISSYYSHNSEFIYNLSYLKNSNVLQQELYGSYRDNFANAEDIVYKFTYDKSNRLLSATNTAGSSNEYAIENTYDKDGNILTLKRYGNAGVMQDDFAYQYYSGTNRLKRVSGTNDQFMYDLNGNLTTDSLNKNATAVYDHRNLLIEIYHKKGSPPARVDYFATRYYYDEAGNRVRKLTYNNNDANAGPVLDWNNTSNPGNSWTLYNNEHYARGVDGKDLATYTNNSLDEWFVWGTDMVGKIRANTKYYFFKDHLGSVRGVIDNNYNIVSAQDFDMWGYLLEDRVHNSDSTKHKFTGKERDAENLYDYFGARYYDSRIGRWGTIEPLLDNYPGDSPYSYSFLNPVKYKDLDGEDAIVTIDGNEVRIRVVINYTLGGDFGLDGGRNNLLESYVDEANQLWNEAGANIKYEEGTIDVLFEIELNYVTEEELQMINSSNSGENIAISSGSNTIGVYANTLVIGTYWNRETFRYTGSHEIGHLMGLEHPNDKERSEDIMGYDYRNRKPPRKGNVMEILDKLDFSKSTQVIKGARKSKPESGGKNNIAKSSEMDSIKDSFKLILPLSYVEYDSTTISIINELLFFDGYMIFRMINSHSIEETNEEYFKCNVFWVDSLKDIENDSRRYYLNWPNLTYVRYIINKINYYDSTGLNSVEDSMKFLNFEKFRKFYDSYHNLSLFEAENLPFTRLPINTSIFVNRDNFFSDSNNDSVGYFIFRNSFYGLLISANLQLRLDNGLAENKNLNILVPVSKSFILRPLVNSELLPNLKQSIWYPRNLFNIE